MSWIFGFIGERVSAELQNKLSCIHPAPLLHHQTQSVYIAAGGIPQTCLFEISNPPDRSMETGWLIVGLGIQQNDLSCKFLDRAGWRKILLSDTPDVATLNGHFIALRWKHNQVECFSDQLGMRTIYFAETEDGVLFSTRLDWILKLKTERGFDFGEFGSHWLTFNHLSYECFIKGVRRLGPGGVASCTPKRIDIKNIPLEPHLMATPVSIDKILMAFLNPVLADESSLSLGLSGGLDSRLLFSVLLTNWRNSFSLHLFGNPSEPDVKIAQQMARDFRIDQIFFPESVPEEESRIDSMKEYIAKTSLAQPVSSWAKLRFHSRLYRMNKIMIDGGMGEIGRRQFLNRLYFGASKGKISGNPKTMAPYIMMHRASVFASDIDQTMRKGIDEQLENVWPSLPSIDKIGYENFLDLFIVHFRFPNYAGLDQARLDEEIVNYMPFAQPGFIQAAFQTSVALKRSGKLYRRMIQLLQPSLTKYPLVKGQLTYPFAFPTIPAWLYTKFKTKTGLLFRNPTRDDFLHSLKEYIYDVIASDSVKGWGAYNYKSIVRLADRYYSGDKALSSDLDWFLSFELWRQSLGIGA